MKKYLLGALFVLGTMAYAQENKVVTPVDASGNASATMGIEVTGKVFSKADLALVVDIKSAAAANGTGFAFEMPNMFAGTADVKTAQGDFEISLEKEGKKVAFEEGTLAINLLQNGTESTTATTEEPAGTATGVKIDYSLLGGSGDIAGINGKTTHKGGVAVRATTKEATTAGTYSDTSVQLKVALAGQKLPTAPEVPGK